MTLLLVEDDARIRQAMAMALTDQGYLVVEAADGELSLAIMSDDSIRTDVVLLDVMLPGIDGIEVCREIRRRGNQPIILVTARSDSADVVAGLEAGADDYVTKPVVASELAARIKALLRRSRPDDSHIVRVGPIRIDTEREQVCLDDQAIELTKTEYRLLHELARAKGALVTREQLLERVWGYDYFADSRVLDVHISRLRNKIEPDSHRSSILLTVRGRGYRVAW